MVAEGIGNIIEVFKAMPAGKRISFLIVFAIVVGGFIALLAYTNRPTYVALFSGMDSTEASKVVEKLKKFGIKYTVSDGGSTVKVPDDMVYQLRLDFAAEGIVPRLGNVGFEIFEDMPFETPELVKKLRYQQALQGELERTIKKLYPLDQVRVHIVSAVESTSTQEGKPVTVSAAVKCHPGRDLNTTQLQKIFNIVSGAVVGLKPENISIVDVENGILTKGNDLTIPRKK